MSDATRLIWYAWLTMAVVAVVLYPVDSYLLPHWLYLQLQLLLLNTYMRWRAWLMWLRFPKPRPPFRYIPIQHRKPL